jgi:hypothetical protein
MWYPVEFNPEHICWVEVCWAEPAGSEGYWQAFRIAGEDLGLDITQEECHGSARTPLGTHANGEDSGLEESRQTIRT